MTRLDGPVPSVVPAVVRWARRQPDEPAVVQGGRIITYGRLLSDALAWAAAVRPSAGGADDLVAVFRPRDVDLPAAQLGVWLAGAAYLPLDPALPDGRIATVLDAAGCTAVLTTPALAARVDGHAVVTRPGAVPDDATAPAVIAGLAYVIYTSGSTGTPKGVEIEHDGLADLLNWYGRRFGFGPGIRVAATAAVGFDQSVLDLWGTLANGGTLIMPGDDVVADTAALVAFLDEQRIQHTYLPAAMAEQLFAGPPWPRTLRSLDVGGEALRRLPPPGFPCPVHNGYGPSETTVLATLSGDLRTADPSAAAPIGTAVAGLTVRLVDDGDNPIEVPGTDGELLIAGPGVARGYRGDPAATAAAFVHAGGRRWYRTGDICRRLDTGDLVFTGRRDGQVKVHGNRIELGEVEHALLTCPGVTQAAAAVAGEGPARAVHAWMVGPAQPGDVRRRLAARLPRYMVPATVTSLPELPYTPSGKVDRAALAAAVDATPDAPRVPEYLSVVEETVAGTWAAVLGRWPGRFDEFSGLGGNSLAAAQVTARLRGIFGITLTLASLLERPVLRDYAAEVGRLVDETEGRFTAAPARIARDRPLPLSYLQENRLTKEVRAIAAGRPRMLSFVPVAVEIHGSISDHDIEAALATLVRRHETLRTGYRLDLATGRAEAILADTAPVRLDRRRPASGDPLAVATRLQREMMCTPIDLERAPLWRATVCRFTDRHAVLVLAVDHLAVDGWAAELLVDEFARALDDADEVADDGLQYADWVAWQRGHLDGPAREAQLRYWRDVLAGSGPFPPLPVPEATEPASSGRATVTIGTGPEATRRLLHEAARRDASPLIATLHALTAGWAEVTGDAEILLHMPVANRVLPEFERIVGWLAHSVVLRVPVGAGGFADTRTAVLGALRHQDVPLPLLVKELQPEAYGHTRRPARLFFSFEAPDARERRVARGTLRALPIPDQERVAEPGISFYASLTGDGLRIEIVSDPADVDQAFVARLATAVDANLHAFAASAPAIASSQAVPA
jgi:amino acid adenylation domain-containing protein